MTYRINVMKRPGCEEFLAKAGEMFEVVVFTASLAEVKKFSVNKGR
jgi:TFIIF-interacting CTD phosphatase-like protein